MTQSNFSNLSKIITSQLTKDEKKKDGIFFSPKSIRSILIDHLKKYIDLNKSYNIVEPSCGSCEFVDDLLELNLKVSITAIEKNKKIYDSLIKNYENKNKIKLIHNDFLKYTDKGDIFIGNPPYFPMNKKLIPKEYEKYFNGRPNIFTLFIIHSLKILNPDGLIIYIIPTSFLNSKYYNLVRKDIYENYTIKDIIMFNNKDFIDTDQDTLGIIIQNKKDIDSNKKFIQKFDSNIIFLNPDIKQQIEKLLVGSTSLKQLGITVKTGPIVWNQYKDDLTSDKTKRLLIYNSNIVNNKLELKEFNNDEKKQYININDYQEGPIIVVNRGNGNTKYKFTFCYLDKNMKYVIENHLNMIIGPEDKLKKVIKSFEDKRTKEFLSLFCGNNGLSKTEIETILPIYL